MSLRITHNVEAMNSYNSLSKTSAAISKSMQRLSSGYRINSAADDAAGLGISESMRSQIRGLAQAQKNIQDGPPWCRPRRATWTRSTRCCSASVSSPSSTRTARSTTTPARRSRTRSTSSRPRSPASATRRPSTASTCSNGATTVSFQVGANDGQQIARRAWSTSPTTVGTSYASLSTTGTTDISEIDTAITAVSTARATFGAVQNRLDHSLSVAASYQENLTSAESRIRDVDMADEMVVADQEPDPVAGRHRDALAGQPGPAERPAPPRLGLQAPFVGSPATSRGGHRAAPLVVRELTAAVEERAEARRSRWGMSVETVMARIAELHQGLLPPSTAAPTTGTSSTAFASTLQDATSSAGVTGAAGTAGRPAPASRPARPARHRADRPAQTAGPARAAVAQGEIGQTEQPPGSNDSPRIAEYRTATAGSGHRPVVRLLRLLGGQAGRRAARRGRPGLRLGLGAVRPGRSAPGAGTPAAAGQRAAARRPDRLGRRARRHRRVRRRRRQDPHHRGQLLQHGHPPHARRRRRRRDRLRQARLAQPALARGARARAADGHAASSVTVPIRRAPGWWRRGSRRPASASASGTTATKPQPMLKTSHISASVTSPRLRDQRRRPAGPAAARRSRSRAPRRRMLFSAAAGDVREAAHGDVGAQQLQHGADVDDRRLQQRVGDARAAELGRACRRAPGRRRPAARGARACSRWSAGRWTGRRSARRRARSASPVTISSSLTVPIAVAQRSKPCGDGWPRISSGRTASSPPGTSMPAASAPTFRPWPMRARRPASTSSTAR